MPVLRVNGVTLFYELRGSGEPLVLVHGSWGDHHNWDSVVPGLAESFRVLVYDRRGHSQSERPAGQGNVQEDIDDLAGLVETLRLEPAHIAGNSFGARIVLGLAGRRPDLFRTLIVHEPPVIDLLRTDPEQKPSWETFWTNVQPLVDMAESGDDARTARSFVEGVAFGPGAWDRLPEPMRQTFIHNAPTWLDEMRDPQALTLDLHGLSAFDRPALLTNGDMSEPYFPVLVEKVAAALPHAQRQTLAGAGHVPHITHPTAYIQTVVSFIVGSAPLAK